MLEIFLSPKTTPKTKAYKYQTLTSVHIAQKNSKDLMGLKPISQKHTKTNYNTKPMAQQFKYKKFRQAVQDQPENLNQIKASVGLFITGFLQVFCVAASTYFIANQKYTGVFLMAFSISWLWSSNVKKIAFGGNEDRLIYAIGASFGSCSGLYISSNFI